MKKLLLFLAFLPACLFGSAAYDLPLTQRNSANTANVGIVISPSVNSLLGFNGSKLVGQVTIGSGLSLSGGTLTASGSGTVTTLSIVTANGVSGSVANPTTTPAVTLTLGAITPSSVASAGAVSGTTLTMSGIGAIDGATPSSSTALILPAGTTGVSSLRVPHGAAPTSPVNGDVWTTTSGIFARINGATVGPFGTAGSGTVTVVGGGSLTSTALVTGGGSNTLQTAAATATMDGSGNISTPGSITSGAGGSAAGYLQLGQGTAPSLGTTAIQFVAPASVTSYQFILPGTSATGFLLGTDATNVNTVSFVGFSGSGNVVRVTGATLVTPALGAATATSINGLTITSSTGTLTISNGKTITFDHTSTFTTTDGATYTFPGSSKTLLATDGSGASLTSLTAANISVGALANGMTGTTQSAGSADTKLATDLYADTAALATHLGTFASPNTAAGSITWTSPVYNIYTSAGSTRTYTLPAASTYVNRAFILFVAVGTGHVNVQPASGAALVLAGVLLTADHYAQLATSAPGNFICWISDGTNWASYGSNGTWADAASP